MEKTSEVDPVLNTLAQRPGYDRSHTDAEDAKDRVPDLEAHSDLDNASSKAPPSIEQDPGVTKIEALYLVFGKGWKLWLLWGSIAAICCAYSLSQTTTYYYTPFATSAYGAHTILGTIAVFDGIMAGAIKPFIAKTADLSSRPLALALSVFFYAIGYMVVAVSKNVATVAAGQILHTIGNTGISFVSSILIADITQLQWRGFVQGAYSLPFVPFAFVSGNIAEGVNAYSENGWRWGYGMFCILVPVTIAPALFVLFWANRKAKRLGALSLASSSHARRMILAGEMPIRRTWYQSILHYAREMDAFGLLLLTFAFGCLLSPSTLSTTAKGGYKNPSLIALYCVGVVLFAGFCIWEWKFSPHPIMPRRVLNKTLICCCGIDFMYYFSAYLSGSYWSSWLYVAKDYSTKEYNYILNIMTVGLCGFAVFVGLIQRYTHRYKYLQICGLGIRVIGNGLMYYGAAKNPSTAVIVMSRVCISLGGAISVTSSSVATQGSVPHQDMAIAMAILSLWTSIGGAVANAISSSVWNRTVPEQLTHFLAPHGFNQTQIKKIFGSIVVARKTEPRSEVIAAYNAAIKPMFLATTITSMIAFLFGALTTNFRLGASHNAIETDKIIRFRGKDETDPEVIAAKAREVEEKIAAELQAHRK